MRCAAISASISVGRLVLALVMDGITEASATYRLALWLAMLAALWLPTWLSIVQGRPMPRLQVWWLLAMLVSGLALGQGL